MWDERPLHLLCIHISQWSQQTAGSVFLTAREHIPQGNRGFLGPGLDSTSPDSSKHNEMTNLELLEDLKGLVEGTHERMKSVFENVWYDPLLKTSASGRLWSLFEWWEAQFNTVRWYNVITSTRRLQQAARWEFRSPTTRFCFCWKFIFGGNNVQSDNRISTLITVLKITENLVVSFAGLTQVLHRPKNVECRSPVCKDSCHAHFSE